MTASLNNLLIFKFSILIFNLGYAVVRLVEALSYKPERRGSIPDGATGGYH